MENKDKKNDFICRECGQGCNTCDETKCVACLDDYSFNGPKCQLCSTITENCRSCKWNPDKCTSCHSMYELNTKENRCVEGNRITTLIIIVVAMMILCLGMYCYRVKSHKDFAEIVDDSEISQSRNSSLI